MSVKPVHRMAPPAAGSGCLPMLWPMLGCLLVILGAKLWLIASYGSATPYWDQWDAEAAGLYKPYLEGTLRLGDLLAPHNEHRIFFTRVLDLALLDLNGAWNPLLQMAVNAVLHTLAVAALLVLLSRALGGSGEVLLLILGTAVVFAVPFGWENTLVGFQSQFYLQLLLTFLALLLFDASTAFSRRWWLAVTPAAASFLCAASGALAPVALATVSAVQIAIGRRKGAREYVAVALLMMLGLALLVLVPTLPHHAPLRAQSLGQFVWAFLYAASWPLPLRALGAVVLHLPMAVLTFRLIRERRKASDPEWLYVALWAWLGLQYLALGYGRAPAATASRYLDTFALGLLLNLAATLHLVRQPLAGRRAGAWKAAAVAWMLAAALAVGTKAVRTVPKAIADRYETSQWQTENLSLFLRTGDLGHLKGKPYLHVPYPDPQRLAQLVSDPTIRAILPAELLPANTGGERSAMSVAALRWHLAWSGPLLMGVGAILLLSSAVARRRRPA